MEETLEYLLKFTPLFILSLFRTSGFFMLSPLFSDKAIPNFAKAALCVILSISILQIVAYSGGELIEFNESTFIFSACLELIVGFVLGYGVHIFFESIMVMGKIVDLQVGYSMASIFDRSQGSQVSITGMLFKMSAISIFIIIDGFNAMVKLFFYSYKALPLGTVKISSQIFAALPQIFIEAYNLGIKMALPMMLGILLVEILLGVVVKVMTQINFFIIGIPIKTLIGLSILLLMVTGIIDNYNKLFEESIISTQGLLNLLGGG